MMRKNLLGTRATAIILAIAMATGMMTGCGNKEETETGMETVQTTEAEANEPDSGHTYDEATEAPAEESPTYENENEYENEITTPAENSQALTSGAEEYAAEDKASMKQFSEVRAYDDYAVRNENAEEYSYTEESGFKSVKKEPLSTFSADVDTASYANLRRMISEGYTMDEIPQDAIRIEEMINYFDYDYQVPRDNTPFSITTEIGDCPWNDDAKLMLVGMQTKEIDFSDAAPSNLVFLLDVSGSMSDEDKLPLLQKAFTMLTTNLTRKDRVSIVTYAGSDEIVLEGAKGNEYERIIGAIEDLDAGGSTAGSAGIMTAYELAEKYFIEGGNNRVILATDGDLNVGLTSENELEKLIEDERKTGVFLSVLGFGTGNIKDNKMELLADKGNGNYSYIDCMTEAKKVLVDEMGATLVTVAKDVKFQVEFNPEVVSEYRLVGYDNRVMAAQDFADDKKDAGEVGAGHSVTALYEIITTDQYTYSTEGIKQGSIDLKYQDKDYQYEEEKAYCDVVYENDIEWLTVSVRYKEPDGNKSKLIEEPVTGEKYTSRNSDDFLFAGAVAEFGMVLRESEYQEDASLEHVLRTLAQTDLDDDERKTEFRDLTEILMMYDCR
ncbi:MAG TPA: VWA domain-containing protein [Lachnospiraceae bacterium]|nr:VWA domain-containing protein [Lachnospiraceae bacterium]